MGIEVRRSTTDSFAEVTYVGRVTDQQVAESVMTLIGWAMEGDPWLVLTDCRQMVWTPTLAEVRSAVEGIAAMVDVAQYREALVLPEDTKARVSAEFYVTAAVNRGLGVRSFPDRDAAESWLLEAAAHAT